MKKVLMFGLLVSLLMIFPVKRSEAIIWVVIKEAAKKVIKAIDLAIQRQQNNLIKLQNAEKALENAMAKLKLKEIGEWSEKQRKQYADYFEELQKVKVIITYYKRIKDISLKQSNLLKEYQRAWKLIRGDRHFTIKEVEYMGHVYAGMLDETIKNMDQIAMIINSFKTQMTDGQRLDLINGAADRVELNYSDLEQFTHENGMLALQRAWDEQDVARIKLMYGMEVDNE